MLMKPAQVAQSRWQNRPLPRHEHPAKIDRSLLHSIQSPPAPPSVRSAQTEAVNSTHPPRTSPAWYAHPANAAPDTDPCRETGFSSLAIIPAPPERIQQFTASPQVPAKLHIPDNELHWREGHNRIAGSG